MVEEVLFSIKNHIGLITLNRPQALNALNLPMILALQAQLAAWKDDDHIHAVVIQSACERAFCAGGDIRAIYHHGQSNYLQKMEFFGLEYKLNQFIYDFGKPYIALMNGITMGGGAGISLHGSHPVASTMFQFAMPETAIGFYPDIGASHFLSRCPDNFGIYLGLTGDRLNAAAAQSLGLVKYVIPAEQFPNIIEQLMTTNLFDDAHQQVDEVLQAFAVSEPVSEIINQRAFVASCFQFIEMESILTALNQESTVWHQKVAEVLATKAPLSLKVTLAQLNKAKRLSMSECLAVDYRLTRHFMQAPDFEEGVRALLIEKDNLPNWTPKTLAEVSDTMVEDYFT